MAEHGPWHSMVNSPGEQWSSLQLQLRPPPVPPLGVIPDSVAGPHPAKIGSKQIQIKLRKKNISCSDLTNSIGAVEQILGWSPDPLGDGPVLLALLGKDPLHAEGLERRHGDSTPTLQESGVREESKSPTFGEPHKVRPQVQSATSALRSQLKYSSKIDFLVVFGRSESFGSPRRHGPQCAVHFGRRRAKDQVAEGAPANTCQNKSSRSE